MADVSINFQHPTDGKVISVTLDDTMTGQEVIGELIANDFVPSSSEGYNIAIKGGNQLDNTKTLLEKGKFLTKIFNIFQDQQYLYHPK